MGIEIAKDQLSFSPSDIDLVRIYIDFNEKKLRIFESSWEAMSPDTPEIGSFSLIGENQLPVLRAVKKELVDGQITITVSDGSYSGVDWNVFHLEEPSDTELYAPGHIGCIDLRDQRVVKVEDILKNDFPVLIEMSLNDSNTEDGDLAEWEVFLRY